MSLNTYSHTSLLVDELLGDVLPRDIHVYYSRLQPPAHLSPLHSEHTLQPQTQELVSREEYHKYTIKDMI